MVLITIGMAKPAPDTDSRGENAGGYVSDNNPVTGFINSMTLMSCYIVYMRLVTDLIQRREDDEGTAGDLQA